MAEIGGMLAAAALKMAAGKMAEAAGDRIMLQWTFSEDLEDMEDTMESIQAVLEDAEGQSIMNASVRLWLKRLTRASNHISDVFDEFEVKKTRKSALQKFKVLNPCLKLAPEVGMVSKMKKVREKLEKISNHHHKFSFTAGSSSSVQQVIDERVTSSEVIEANIVGRDNEKRELMELLTRPNTAQEVIIVPIYGIGGMGKTTLAQLLFNDTHFKDYRKAWVYIGQSFDLERIKCSIESKLQMDQDQVPNTQELGVDPSASKKILIVLDDLWEKNETNLDSLKDYLNRIRNGHKLHIIITTRDGDIAKKIKTTEAHKIATLSTDVCWNIIKQIAGFRDKDEADKGKLENIGKEIAKKCGGVALAARALGYTLRSRNYDGWVLVKDSGIWNASTSGYTSLPYDNDNVLASLKLSYSSMLPHLRLCFACCAIFPKGCKMAKDDLIFMWAALGFVKQSEEVSIWQHGEICIKQLLDMSFFQHSESPSSDRKNVALFTMHDLVHDLARSAMGDELLDASEQRKFGGRNCRYAFLEDCSKPLNSFLLYPDKIRALRFLRSGETGHCSSGFSAAKYLRVLDFGECSLKKLPSSIGRLKMLRYLNAPRMKDWTIPSCITKLTKLIYLSLRGSYYVLALPESIGEMEALMYLDLSGCSAIRKLPSSFGKLQSLVHADLSNCSRIRDLSESLGNLTQLRYLNLTGCLEISKLPKSFGKLENLVHLDLSYCSLVNGMSEALCSLTRLQYLNISQEMNEKGGQDVRVLSEVIRKLTELRYLNVSGSLEMESGDLNDFFGSISALSNLEHLDLSSNLNIRAIPDSICSLKKLHTLDLTNCMSLRTLPETMDRMDSLKFLIVNYCWRLDMSTLPINKSLIPLPNFVVRPTEGDQSSNLILLKNVNPSNLEISGLENVKSKEEARRIELKEKQNMVHLTLEWTTGKERFVESVELLSELFPPSTLKTFKLQGYDSVSFPAWLMCITDYLPNLVTVHLTGLSQCSSLPPLGQLPNLENLSLDAMPRITKIDRGTFGDGMNVFGHLKDLTISDIENLEEWRTTYSHGEGIADEFMFPNLKYLSIIRCPKLRVGPCPPRVHLMNITESDGVLVQWEVGVSHTVCSTSSAALVDFLGVRACMAPMHQWKLLCHLPALSELTIHNCSDLSSSPEITRGLSSLRSLELSECQGIRELPHWLRDLTCLRSLRLFCCSGIQALPDNLGDYVSLEMLGIWRCEGITSFPESIKQLTNLKSLDIGLCPELRKWCELEENMTKIDHIKKKDFNDWATT